MKKIVVLLLVVMALGITGCKKEEAKVPTLGSPQPRVETETILIENIETENVIDWESSSVTTWEDVTG